MVSLLQVKEITKSYGDRMLFENVTFGVYEGDKIGIIAKNGTGKSTLLSIIAGKESADSGTITFANGVKTAFLPQDPEFDPDANAITAVAGTNPVPQLEEKAVRLLTMLGVHNPEGNLRMGEMSGGQIKRVALAKAILADPQLLILDEPTNHLDISTVEWLENYLSRSRMALLMVTHDRYFLDRVCNKIIEIDLSHIFTYEGNYDQYLRRRQERINALKGDVEKARNLMRREQDWMNRQPQARAGKAKYRIDAFYDLKERASKRYDEKNLDASDVKSAYIGSKIFEARNISKSFGDKVILDDFSYTFARYEKVGIVGENGVGKSTFIKMLQGLIPADQGEWNVGETVRFGYYSQEGLNLDPGKKVIDAITEIAEEVHVSDNAPGLTPMQFLNRFLFSVQDQQKFIEKLSGGERRRLQLAVTLMKRPNFLILDEPTNDLDIVTLAILEDYLREFKGCVIVVSHDRFFLDSIVDHLFVMQGNGVVKDFPGNYSDYRGWLSDKPAEKSSSSEKPKNVKTKQPKERKLTFKERKELECINQELEKLNQEKASLEQVFQGTKPCDDLSQASQRYSQVKQLLDEKEMRWLELMEIEDP